VAVQQAHGAHVRNRCEESVHGFCRSTDVKVVD
jgi:hypothetical protein